MMDKLHSVGLKVGVYFYAVENPEKPEYWPHLIAWGVDKIITDYPEQVLELINSSQ